MTASSQPSIAILIATMNRAAMLRECLASCASQTEPPDRLGVIDGGSADGTLDVIREFGSLVTCSISEPDQGIFDTLNKGLRHVRHDDYVLVLGSDDRLYDDAVLADARSRITADPGHSIYYGRVQMVEEDGRETATRGVPWNVVRADHLAGRLSGMPHQATFQLADSLLRFGGFDSRYRICGDYDALFRVLKHEEPVFWPDRFISRMRRGGISTEAGSELAVLRERVKLCWKHRLLGSWLRQRLALSRRSILAGGAS
jgi:glycosyltransferase involved in cell wall biosynthesis